MLLSELRTRTFELEDLYNDRPATGTAIYRALCVQLEQLRKDCLAGKNPDRDYLLYPVEFERFRPNGRWQIGWLVTAPGWTTVVDLHGNTEVHGEQLSLRAHLFPTDYGEPHCYMSLNTALFLYESLRQPREFHDV